jgi:hypothetical protein
MRKGDEDVSERLSESRVSLHRARPGRLEQFSGLGPDAGKQVEETFVRR